MSQPTVSRFALAFIFMTMFIDTVGLGIVIPVTPKLIAELIGQSAYAPHAMSNAAWYGGWLMAVFAGMQFFFSPLLGNLSDRFGRRPVLITSLVALAIDYAITGAAPSIAWLFIGRALSGMAGATFATANAYIADVSPPEKRAANFGITGAAFSIGFVIGPVIGGFLGEYSARLPFFVSAAIAIANALFGLFVLKESLPMERRRKLEWWRANPLGALVALRRYPTLIGLVGVVVFMRLAHDANPSVFTYYTMLKFHWSPRDVALALGAFGVLMAGVYGFLPRLLVPRIGETMAVVLGLTFQTIAFAGYALATTGWMMFGWMAVWTLQGLAGPALSAIQTKLVPPNEQGELQGGLACVGGLTSIAAPALLTNLFSYFTGPSAPVYFPGAAFLAAAICAALALLLFVASQPRLRAAARPA